MVKNIIPIFILSFLFLTAGAQNKKAKKFAKTITEKDLYNRLAVLASDSLEGRETGEIGQKKAADFIRGEFKRFGLQPIVESNGEKSYFQSFDLYKMVNNEIYLKAGSKRFNFIEDIVFFGNGNSGGEQTKEVVFIGDGTVFPEDVDLTGKIALFFNNQGNWRNTVAKSIQKGAAANIVVIAPSEGAYQQTLKSMAGFMKSSRLSVDKPGTGQNSFNFLVGPNILEEIFPLSAGDLKKKAGDLTSIKEVQPVSVSYNVDRGAKEVSTENVLGFLPGTDLKDEILVITSHYDHIGKSGDVINNGADDDGSGTTSVLEIAQAFGKAKAKKKGPRRSILFMTVTGEEKGLLGSDYYTKNPVLPLESTVTNLNIDMVGRVDSAHIDDKDYIYVIGSDKLSTELHELSVNTNNNTLKLNLDYKYNDENDPNRFYYRSDHYNFAKNDIPIIFYFNGVHPDYHRPTDTIEKIDFPVMRKRATLVFYTAWEIANRDARVKLD